MSMTVKQRILRAAERHPEEVSAEIAERVGTTAGYARLVMSGKVYKYSDDSRKRKWAADPANRAACVVCGAQTSVTRGKYAASAMCQPCSDARLMIAPFNRRWVIETMWNKGYSLNDIAAALGSTRGAVSVSMRRLRQTGWDLPLRPAGRRSPHKRIVAFNRCWTIETLWAEGVSTAQIAEAMLKQNGQRQHVGAADARRWVGAAGSESRSQTT